MERTPPAIKKNEPAFTHGRNSGAKPLTQAQGGVTALACVRQLCSCALREPFPLLTCAVVLLQLLERR